MSKNIPYLAAFIHLNTSNFVLVSKKEESVYDAVEKLKESLVDTDAFSIHYEELTTKSRLNKTLHDSVVELLKNEDSIVKVDHVVNASQLEMWFLIQSDKLIPDSKWAQFLFDNNLLKLWISGSLKGVLGIGYKESSKDCGYKQKYQERAISFDNHQSIWDFPNYFSGTVFGREGDSAKFRYSQETRLVKIRESLLNVDWSNSFKTPVYDQKFNLVGYQILG